MVRARGFEELAQDLGHEATFLTITCPSKYHRSYSKSGAINPKWEGLTPLDGQAYLNKQWQLIRAKLNRLDIRFYGFRVAEPQHDGTPHWHLLLFVEKHQYQKMVNIMRDYALREDGDEIGADKHRFTVVKIDPKAGILAAFMPSQLGDGTLYNENDLMDKTTVETNIRLGFNADNRIYGYHVNGVNIPKREVNRVSDKFIVELEPDVTIEWIPMSGDFGGKPILVNPIPDLQTYNIWVYPEAEQGQEFDNTYITPIADADLQDYILTFPADTGLPPLYVVYSHQVRQPNGQFGASKHPKPNLDRTTLRADTKRQIEEEAEKNAQGQFIDDKGNVITDWHYGHRFGVENRRILLAADQIGMTQEELNDFVNSHPDYFLIEDAKTNLSHVNEKPGSDDLRKILRDMRAFLKNRKT
ncbi:Bacteriophage replication gene A protein (GPA) [Vibrio spartinae]|uniref:Bacteriophage replication gene A protein (GPA) n=2 Tax=Vibrio spartinae TaxID=1918945 RepID=A0A1N6MAT0_9VIBR|nr:Bacteriophage replication gene A protein (GPA) [Vibrio spartinae]